MDQKDENDPKYEPRYGTENDAKNLETTFEFLGYQVENYPNCDSDKMVTIFEDLVRHRKCELKAHDSFVCCVLSHGGKLGIISSNCRHVAMEDMVSPLRNCKELENKPKMFFVQACRGTERDVGLGIADDDASTELPTAPKGADFFLGFATEAGHRAYRTDQSTHGSYYIDALCRVFLTYGKHSNLISMHTMINHDISEVTIQIKQRKYKQISEFEDRLRNFVYFFQQEWMD